MVVPKRKNEVKDSYLDDDELKFLMATMLLNEAAYVRYKYVNEVLRYKGRIYIRFSNDTRKLLMEKIHLFAMGEHSGIKKHSTED